VGAVVCMQMVASARPDMQRSRMAGGQTSMAGSMLLRAATMGPGQCLNAEAFLPDGELVFGLYAVFQINASSMLLRASTMGPGQCLNAEVFLPDGKLVCGLYAAFQTNVVIPT